MMRHGDRGTEVRGWQRWLVSRGYDLQADGIYGPRTEAATRAIQRAAGLQASGVVDDATLALSREPEAPPGPDYTDDEQAIRYGHVERALAVVGLGAADRAPYLDLIAPCPSDRADVTICRDLASMSGCARAVRGLWVRAGVRASRLTAPYRVGRAVADVVAVADAAGALRPPSHEPRPGDVVIIGTPEHVLTVVSVRGPTIVSVDGGQRDALGKQTIARKERLLQGAYLGGRPILYVIDCVELSRAWSRSDG